MTGTWRGSCEGRRRVWRSTSAKGAGRTGARGGSGIATRWGRRGRRGACLDVALALGYVEGIDASLLDALDKVRATLVKVAL